MMLWLWLVLLSSGRPSPPSTLNGIADVEDVDSLVVGLSPKLPPRRRRRSFDVIDDVDGERECSDPACEAGGSIGEEEMIVVAEEEEKEEGADEGGEENEEPLLWEERSTFPDGGVMVGRAPD